MPLIGGAITVGGTFAAPTGGNSRTLVSLGADKSSVKLLIDDSAEFRLRSLVNVSVQDPSVNSGYPGGYTPAKRRMAYAKPIVLADGSIFVNQTIVEFILHPETTVAQITEQKSVAAALVTDGDTSAFVTTGSLS